MPQCCAVSFYTICVNERLIDVRVYIENMEEVLEEANQPEDKRIGFKEVHGLFMSNPFKVASEG